MTIMKPLVIARLLW